MKACIFGCESYILTDRERAFFRETDPLGFILFSRNCYDPDQLRRLIASLREAVGREAMVLIDEEGGRVQRMKSPKWRNTPAPGVFGELFEQDPIVALELARINARLIAEDLYDVGIDVNCAPSLDLREPGGHHVIGNRAFSSDPDTVVTLGRIWMEGMSAGGVIPVIKHLPGHGRTQVDSHHDLPVIDASLEELDARDFIPFMACSGNPIGMTGHLLFNALDDENPVTLSRIVIADVVRGRIGFDGLLLTDDLSMEALGEDIGTRAAGAIMAGCDIALHCNGKTLEMNAVACSVPELEGKSLRRANRAVAVGVDLKARREPLNRNYAELILRQQLAAV